MILSLAGLPMGGEVGVIGVILFTQTDPSQHAITMGSGMLSGCFTTVVLAASLLLVSLGIRRTKRWALRGLVIWTASVLLLFAAVGAVVVWSSVTDQPFAAALAPPLVILGIGVVVAVVLLIETRRLRRSVATATAALLTTCLLFVACSSRGPSVPSESGQTGVYTITGDGLVEHNYAFTDLITCVPQPAWPGPSPAAGPVTRQPQRGVSSRGVRSADPGLTAALRSGAPGRPLRRATRGWSRE